MDDVFLMVKDTSVSRFKTHMKIDEIQVSIPANCDANVIRSFHTVIILISGDDIKMTFKSHFDSELAGYLCAKALKKESVSWDKAIDFMKEYSNVVAGKIKKFFMDQEVIVGLSLPIVTRGFDEIFFEPPETGNVLIDNWILSIESNHLYCTCIAEILNKNRIQSIKYPLEKQATDESDGEVSFL
ncbi:MAG: hypothetical protein HQK52_05160 [Oligoflexia bacterium]|nr:hypothetical protein [Oligoflexia bacterium]